MVSFPAIALLLLSPFQDEPLPPPPSTPEELAERLEKDGIRFDRELREVHVRGDLLRRRRSREYPVEYGLVTESGATHEAFGIVKCTPSVLNACFLALGLQPGKPRRRVWKEPLPPREEVETGLIEPFVALPPEGDRVFLYVVWKEGDGPDAREVARAFEDFFIDLRDLKPLPMRGYVYLGSRMIEVAFGKEKRRVYIADYEGNIVTLHPDKMAAENCLFDVYSFDEEPYVWADVDEEKLPPEGVALDFVFTLATRPGTREFEPEPPIVPIPLPPARELAKTCTNPCLDGTHDEWLDRLGTLELHELAKILQRARPPLREVAADLLGSTRRDEAVEPLALSLRFDRSPDVRLACAFALAEIGSKAAFQALVRVVERGATLARDDALVALRYASGEDFGTRPLAWSQWVEQRR